MSGRGDTRSFAEDSDSNLLHFGGVLTWGGVTSGAPTGVAKEDVGHRIRTHTVFQSPGRVTTRKRSGRNTQQKERV